MDRNRTAMLGGLACLLLALAPAPAPAQELLEFRDTPVAGADGDFMQVRHLYLRGDNFAIGRRLAELARRELGVEAPSATDSHRVRAQRAYLARNYPIHVERMRGAAAAFGLPPDDPTRDFSSLPYHTGLPGCSVVYYPPGSTLTGHGVLSRNFDFGIGTLLPTPEGAVPLPPVASRPFVIEVHPDQGYPALYLCLFDLLSGALDGVNSEGLVVAVLADDETPKLHGVEPTLAPAVGLNEVQILRFLLDTCANADEARQALLGVKHYYGVARCHYLVADRAGQSFVWEYSASGNRQYILEGKGKPQVATNFMLYRHPDASRLPREGPPSMYWRYRELLERAEAREKHSRQEMKENNLCVAVLGETLARPPHMHRTLWHALYDAQERSLAINFYLGEEPDPERPGRLRTRQSGYLDFRLSRPGP